MFCIDASVIISAARGGEPHSDRSKAFLDDVRRDQLKAFLPEIAIVEVASGLFRATKDAAFSTAFVQSLRAIPNFSFVVMDSRLTDRAVEVIGQTGLRSADALYVALAFDYGLTLITLDREQRTKSRSLISVREP